jgi:adenylate cyclase
MAESTERRLAAIMFTDLVGSTALMARSEELALAVKQRHRSLVRPLVERYHGRWIESPGDETLSTFPNSLDAVNCALAIQEGRSGDEDLRIHVGMHVGDVIDRDGEIHGDGVNIAARVCSLSDGGGICITGEVHQSVRNQANMQSTPLEERDLKNVGRAVSVFSVEGEPHPPSARGARSVTVLALAAAVVLAVGVGGWWLGRPTVDASTIRSIAVLPLENLSGDPEQEYFADGVTDALIESLARVGPDLRVISRTSVMQYKRTTKPSPEIADELGVEFLIEGTAQRQDDRVLIRVQLIEAREDTHLWAKSYERDLRDFFSVQREIARAVAAEVHVALKPEREPLLAATRPVDPEALDLYLRAVTLRGPINLVASWGPPAIELLERSVALDPDFANGWVALAEAHSKLGFAGFGAGSRDDLVRSREASQRALELDAHLGAAHARLGFVRLNLDWDFSGARSAFERAVELSPSDPAALQGLATYLLIVGLGKSPEAELLLERLLRVAPLDLFYRAQRINHFLNTREYERGIAEVERVRELHPEYVDIVIAAHYRLLGQPEDADRELLAYLAGGGAAFEPLREAFQRGSEEGGYQGGVRATTRLLIEAATQGAHGLSYVIAIALAGIGETEEAMTWLERAYEERDPLLVTAKVDPRMDPIRSDPRFQDLLRRIGFPES